VCRLLAYFGSSLPLDQVVLEHPHSLLEQSYAPREMVTGQVNADGFGIGWYADGAALPGTYHRSTPIWSDLDLPRFGRVVASGRVFAALRNASPGFPADQQSVPPFCAGPFLFVHNGAIQAFARRMRRQITERIPDAILGTVLGPTDAEAVFGLVRARLEGRGAVPDDEPGPWLRSGLEHAVREVITLAREKRLQVSLNMGITDGRGMAFCRLARGIRPNSLYVRSLSGGVWVASEPLDADPDWQEVPHDTWLTVGEEGILNLDPMEGLPAEDDWS